MKLRKNTLVGVQRLILVIGLLLLFIVPVSATSTDWYLTDEQGIHPESAWNLSSDPDNSDDIIIAVLSTGIDYTHPELINIMWNASDGTHGRDVTSNSSEIMDTDGIGTHCAGIIGDVLHGREQIKIMGVIVGNTPDIYDSNLVSAINFAQSNGADIIVMSVKMSGYSIGAYRAIQAAESSGILCICSAGDTGKNIDTNPYYPSSYSLSNLISVAASNSLGEIDASYSNYGIENISLTAPGTGINAAYLQSKSTYKELSGTAGSAAITAASAAIIKSINPTLSPAEIKTLLVTNTNSLATGSRSGGAGILNLSKSALAAANNVTKPVRIEVNESMIPAFINATGNESVELNSTLYNRFDNVVENKVNYTIAPSSFRANITTDNCFIPERNVSITWNETNVTITLSAERNSSVVKTVNLTVVNLYPETIKITPSSTSLLIGSEATFTGEILDQTGKNLTDYSLNWNSSNPSVGTINESTGNFTAISAGTTIITANITGSPVNATATVTVTQPMTTTNTPNTRSPSSKYQEQTIIYPSSANSEFIGTTPTPTPTSTSLPVPTVATQKPTPHESMPSPAPIAGIIAGLGIAIFIVANRRK